MPTVLAVAGFSVLCAIRAAPVRAQEPVPEGLEAVETARTRACLVDAAPAPTIDVDARLADEAPGLIEILETSRVAGAIRGGGALPPEFASIGQWVERYNREYTELLEDCRNDRNADGLECGEDEALAELRAEIRQRATDALRTMAERIVESEDGTGAGHAAWARACDDRLLLRPVVESVCDDAPDAPACAAVDADAFELWGVRLGIVEDVSTLWNRRPAAAWSDFEPLRPEDGHVEGGFTETVLRFGNVIAMVRLALDVVDVAAEPDRAERARAFGAAFDMSFETSGLTVLPVIEFSLAADAPILAETVYAFFVETDDGPRTVLNAAADPERPFSWVTPLRPEVAEWLQQGRTLWFTAGGPIPGGGMGPRFTVPFSTDGLGDAVLDLAIYLGEGVFADLRAIADAR